jgi:G6PDH family F420-dependent oxidoreductase
MLDGRFCLGVGSGEALNEHILGDPWPESDERLEMLEEAVEVIRLLWEGGVKSHRGRHYRVEHAQIYDLPDTPPKIIVSGFGSKAVEVAGRIGDGYCTVGPDAESVKQYRSAANGNGDGVIVQGGLKVCWADDAAKARKTVHRLWANEGLPGELAQILPTPAHFEQASELVTEEVATEGTPCGPDVDEHIEAIMAYADAGFDELYVNQIGPEQDAFFAAYAEHVLPRLRR